MNKNGQKFVLSALLAAFVFIFVFAVVSIKTSYFESDSVVKVQAQTPDPAGPPLIAAVHQSNFKRTMEWLKNRWNWVRDKVIVRSAKIAYKNALRNFLGQMAHRTAVWISQSGRGQGPLFTTESWQDFSKNIVETTIVDSLDVLASDNGFFEFNVCQPSDLNFAMDIIYTAFLEVGGPGTHKPKCTFQQLKKRWDKFGREIWQDVNIERVNQEEFLDLMGDAFKPTEQNVGIALKIDESISKRIQNKKVQQFFQRLENQGLEPITEKITGKIKTPAKFVGFQAQTLAANAPVNEETPTGDIVADAMGIFTNTLVSKLIDRWLSDATGGVKRAETTREFAWSAEGGRSGAGQDQDSGQFAKLAAVSFTSGQERILEQLSNCPDPDNPGPLDCVMPPKLMTALDQKMTVQQAMDKNLLEKNWVVGWLTGGGQDAPQQPSYLTGYPYRSLVILRTQRIIPVGWELAAWYAREKNVTVTLGQLLHCFEDANPELADNPEYPEDCRDADLDYNPYYHLVDPNWVLKAPETYCGKKGAGFMIAGEEWACAEDNVDETCPIGPTCPPEDVIDEPNCDAKQYQNPDRPVKLVTRESEYCADWQTCLFENDDGSCAGVWGYCLEEEEFWKFDGESCPAQFNSCQTLTRKLDQAAFSFLTNTLNACSQSNAGCSWYAMEQDWLPPENDLTWLTAADDRRIYLNETAASCEIDDVGCTKVGRMILGMNTVVNGDFAIGDPTDGVTSPDIIDLPTDWSSAAPNCDYIHHEDSQEMEIVAKTINDHCTFQAQGFIPINPDFTYRFSYRVKAGSGATAAFGLGFYNDSNGYIDSQMFNGEFDPADDYTVYSFQIGPESAGGQDFSSGTSYAKPLVYGPYQNGVTLWADYVELTIINSPVQFQSAANLSYATATAQYITDYSHASNNANVRRFLKLAPDYLNCDGYNDILYQYSDSESCSGDGHYWRTDIDFCVAGGDGLCDEYANYCKAEEIGCQGYTPVNGGLEIPAKVSSADACPAACENYDSYMEQPAYFEEVECPMYQTEDVCLNKGCFWKNNKCQGGLAQRLFIPQTSQECAATEVGCEEFTNLDEVAQGGEGKEYYTYFRQCISPDNSNIKSYFTWEGSDTEGYQLKKWSFLKSNLFNYRYFDAGWVPEADYGPCTNIAIGSEECQDVNDPNPNTPGAPKTCSQADIDNGDYDCRDFFDAAGNHYFRKQSYAVTSSSQCHPYRRTTTGQIYNADPAEGASCSAASSGCRQYKGNAGNNVRNIFINDFEQGGIGNWRNFSGNLEGLEYSNESVVQGGHSLKVYLDNNSIIQAVTGLSGGKKYKLSFWAKKAPLVNCPAKPIMGDLTGEYLSFHTFVTNDWQQYQMTAESAINPTAVIVKIDGLTSCEAFYLDNIVLTEFTDNFYAVRDSWQTPVACDNNINNSAGEVTCNLGHSAPLGGEQCLGATPDGQSYSCFVPENETSCRASGVRLDFGAQLGCQQYQDRDFKTQFLKSFSYICRGNAIGCEALITTNNSSDYQSEHIYYNDSFVCDGNVGEIDASFDCRIRGQVMCNTGGSDSCSYQDYPDASPPAGNKVANDEIVYAVVDPEKTCAPEKQGCMLLGQPQLNKQLDDLNQPDYVLDVADVFLTNNPDSYQSTLCAPSGEFCASYASEDSAGYSYYYDPMSQGGGEGQNKTCYFSTALNQWLISGSENEPCPGSRTVIDTNYLARTGDIGYEGWTGLCEPKYSSCVELRDPEQPYLEAAGECDAAISPLLTGHCDNVVQFPLNDPNAKYYCQASINGLDYKVCEGDSECDYSAYNWFCDLGATVNGSTQCCVGAGTPSCDNESEVVACNVEPGQRRCLYSMACQSYYYQEDSLDKENSQCGGVIDREKGCLPFNNTAGGGGQSPELIWSSDSSNDGAVAICDQNSTMASASDCDANAIMPVVKDRQCGEWLQCGSGYQLENGENVCVSLIKCSEVSSEDPSVCTNVIATVDPQELVVEFADKAPDAQNGINNFRYMSGFSHVGADWGDGITSRTGYFSPENMEQVGQNIDIEEADFESFPFDNWVNNRPDYVYINKTPSWNYGGTNPDCYFYQDNETMHSGRYSLKIKKTSPTDPGKEWCDFSSYGTEQVYNFNGSTTPTMAYPINPEQRYNLTFWMKSQDGAQDVWVNLFWIDASGQPCYPSNGYCNGGVPVFGQNTSDNDDLEGYGSKEYYQVPAQWQKYTITIGPAVSPDEPSVDIEIPPLADTFNIGLFAVKVNTSNGQPGSVWFDDFAFEPALQVTESDINNKECRLFPKDDSPACAYKDLVEYQGWNGYCLEPDPFVSYNPDPASYQDYQHCLQWYPLDSLAGDPLSVFSPENIGYQGPDNVYYCAQSEGLYNLNSTDLDAPGYFTNGYRIQSDAYGYSFNNSLYCTNSHYNGYVDCDNVSHEGKFNLSYCMDDDENSSIACFWDSNITGVDCSWPAHPLPDLDGNVNRNKLSGIFLQIYNGDGGWDKPNQWFDFNGTRTFGAETLYEYYVDALNDLPDDSEGCEFWVWFNQTDGMLRGIRALCHDGERCGGANYNIEYYYANDICIDYVQLVSNGTEKGWLTRLEDNWTIGQQNKFGYPDSLARFPYGSITGFETDEPYRVELGGPGYALSGMPYSTQNDIEPYLSNLTEIRLNNDPNNLEEYLVNETVQSGRMCVGGSDLGKNCKSNADCQDGTPINMNPLPGFNEEGTCMGIGKYCYSADGYTNGTPCIIDSDCSSEYNSCKAIGFTDTDPLDPAGLDIEREDAINNLQQLFVEAYGAWGWNGSEYSAPYAPSFTWDRAQEFGQAVQINNVKVNGVTGGDIFLPVPGGNVALDFNTRANADQLPLETICIDWHDGNIKCFNDVGNHKPSEDSPHRVTHTYSCVGTIDNNRCYECLAGGVLVDGSCAYDRPSINVKDHWEWCANVYGGAGDCNPDDGVFYGGPDDQIIIRPND